MSFRYRQQSWKSSWLAPSWEFFSRVSSYPERNAHLCWLEIGWGSTFMNTIKWTIYPIYNSKVHSYLEGCRAKMNTLGKVSEQLMVERMHDSKHFSTSYNEGKVMETYFWLIASSKCSWTGPPLFLFTLPILKLDTKDMSWDTRININ